MRHCSNVLCTIAAWPPPFDLEGCFRIEVLKCTIYCTLHYYTVHCSPREVDTGQLNVFYRRLISGTTTRTAVRAIIQIRVGTYMWKLKTKNRKTIPNIKRATDDLFNNSLTRHLCTFFLFHRTTNLVQEVRLPVWRNFNASTF